VQPQKEGRKAGRKEKRKEKKREKKRKKKKRKEKKGLKLLGREEATWSPFTCRIENDLEIASETIEKVTVIGFKQRIQGTGTGMVAMKKERSCCQELSL